MNRLTLYIDGGARGNPGDSGYGIYAVDEAGDMVAEIFGYLGRQTNNFAEYHGLLEALKFARRMKLSSIAVLSDSELLVRQILGQYKIKSPTLRPLYEQAQRMIREIPDFSIRHIRREQNSEADRLANLAMTTRKTEVRMA